MENTINKLLHKVESLKKELKQEEPIVSIANKLLSVDNNSLSGDEKLEAICNYMALNLYNEDNTSDVKELVEILLGVKRLFGSLNKSQNTRELNLVTALIIGDCDEKLYDKFLYMCTHKDLKRQIARKNKKILKGIDKNSSRKEQEKAQQEVLDSILKLCPGNEEASEQITQMFNSLAKKDNGSLIKEQEGFEEEIDKIVDLAVPKNIFYLLQKAAKDQEEIKTSSEEIIELANKADIPIPNLVEFMGIFIEYTSVAATLLTLQKKVLVDTIKETYEQSCQDDPFYAKMTKKQRKRDFIEGLKEIDVYGTYKSYEKDCDDAHNLCLEVLNKDRKRKADLSKQIKLYEGIIASLRDSSDKEIDITKQVLQLKDENLKRTLLLKIYAHNEKIQIGIQQRYQELSNNDILRIGAILVKNGIQYTPADLKQIMNKPLEEINTMLKILKTSFNEMNPSEKLAILKVGSKQSCEQMASLYAQGILTIQTLTENKSLFNENSIAYKTIRENLQSANDYQINPIGFEGSEIILLDPKQFKKSLEDMSNYDLLPQLKETENYGFMAQDDLLANIDMLLELGYEWALEEDLDILNYDSNFKRLKVIKMLNIPVDTKEELIDLLTTRKFYVKDEEIDQYISDAVKDLPQEFPEENDSAPYIDLEKYQESERVYNINGTRLSKNRVERNLQQIESERLNKKELLFALTNGAALTEQELKPIKNIIGINSKQSNV